MNDFAGLMSDNARQSLESALRAVREKTGAEIAVVTVSDLGGSDEKTYAVELMQEWGIGSKELNDGILILIALEERLLRIEVGYGLEAVVTDAKAGQIRDQYMIPYLKKNDWDNGITQGALAVAALIAEDKGMKLEDVVTGSALARPPQGVNPTPLMKILFFVILFLIMTRRSGRNFLLGMLLSSAMRSSGRRSGFGGFSGGFGGGGGFSGFGGGFSGGGGASGRF